MAGVDPPVIRQPGLLSLPSARMKAALSTPFCDGYSQRAPPPLDAYAGPPSDGPAAGIISLTPEQRTAEYVRNLRGRSIQERCRTRLRGPGAEGSRWTLGDGLARGRGDRSHRGPGGGAFHLSRLVLPGQGPSAVTAPRPPRPEAPSSWGPRARTGCSRGRSR